MPLTEGMSKNGQDLCWCLLLVSKWPAYCCDSLRSRFNRLGKVGFKLVSLNI